MHFSCLDMMRKLENRKARDDWNMIAEENLSQKDEMMYIECDEANGPLDDEIEQDRENVCDDRPIERNYDQEIDNTDENKLEENENLESIDIMQKEILFHGHYLNFFENFIKDKLIEDIDREDDYRPVELFGRSNDIVVEHNGYVDNDSEDNLLRVYNRMRNDLKEIIDGIVSIHMEIEGFYDYMMRNRKRLIEN